MALKGTPHKALTAPSMSPALPSLHIMSYLGCTAHAMVLIVFHAPCGGHCLLAMCICVCMTGNSKFAGWNIHLWLNCRRQGTACFFFEFLLCPFMAFLLLLLFCQLLPGSLCIWGELCASAVAPHFCAQYMLDLAFASG